MAASRIPRVGDIFWLDDCEPLRGDTAKKRPVVVMSPPEAEAILQGIFVVACTSSAYPTDTLAIELPNHPLGRVRTGLRRMTWAVPQWYVLIRRERLREYTGYISGPLLHKLLTAFQQEYDRKHPDQSRGGGAPSID